MEGDKEDETMEGNHKEDKGNTNEDELRQTPTKRLCYIVKVPAQLRDEHRHMYLLLTLLPS